MHLFDSLFSFFLLIRFDGSGAQNTSLRKLCFAWPVFLFSVLLTSTTERIMEVSEDAMDAHRMAVVVFTTVTAADKVSARLAVECAVSAALGMSGIRSSRPVTITADLGDDVEVPVTVNGVRELDAATYGNYLKIDPDDSAYRREGV